MPRTMKECRRMIEKKKINLQYSLDPADAPEFVNGPQEFQFPPDNPEPGAAVCAAFEELYMSKRIPQLLSQYF